METKIERRNMWLQVLWMVLTFGLYSIYWFYVTSREMVNYEKRDENYIVWTIFFGFPPFCLYSYFKHGEVFEKISKPYTNRWLTFILWIFFPPAVWFIVQRRLNEIADRQRLGVGAAPAELR